MDSVLEAAWFWRVHFHGYSMLSSQVASIKAAPCWTFLLGLSSSQKGHGDATRPIHTHFNNRPYRVYVCNTARCCARRKHEKTMENQVHHIPFEVLIADQVLRRMEFLHSLGLIHRVSELQIFWVCLKRGTSPEMNPHL